MNSRGVRNSMRTLLRRAAVLAAVAVSLVALSILGTGVAAAAPIVTFTPSSLTFAAQTIGTTSSPQSVTVANTGDAPLFINSAAIGGANPLDFTVVGDGCSGLTLGAGSSCTMSITFSPTASGTRSALLNVTDNAAGTPQSVSITGGGTGTTPPVSINTQFFTCTSSA